MRTWQFGQEILDPSYLEYDPDRDTWVPGEFKSLPNRRWVLYCNLWTWARVDTPLRQSCTVNSIYTVCYLCQPVPSELTLTALSTSQALLAPLTASAWRVRIPSGDLVQNPHVPLLPTVGFTASHKRQEAWIRSSPEPNSLSGMLLSCARVSISMLKESFQEDISRVLVQITFHSCPW